MSIEQGERLRERKSSLAYLRLWTRDESNGCMWSISGEGGDDDDE